MGHLVDATTSDNVQGLAYGGLDALSGDITINVSDPRLAPRHDSLLIRLVNALDPHKRILCHQYKYVSRCTSRITVQNPG